MRCTNIEDSMYTIKCTSSYPIPVYQLFLASYRPLNQGCALYFVLITCPIGEAVCTDQRLIGTL
jgi:hypothetical protein